MRRQIGLSVILATLLMLTGCAAPSTPTPLAPFELPTKMAVTAGPTPAVPLSEEAATQAPVQASTVPEPTEPPLKESVEQPTAEATVMAAAAFRLPGDVKVEPTRPARPGTVEIDELALGEPGTYQNLVYGYQLAYPETWYTGFGNRPVVVLFSNLDPAEQNREAMRSQGCLVEIRATANIYDLSLDEIVAQMPKAFAGAVAIDLDGEPALRVSQSESSQATASETIYVEHQDQLFVISIEYSLDESEHCLRGWNLMIDSWKWFEPASALYKNREYGYGIAVPNTWYLFSRSESSLWISSTDPEILYASDAPLSMGMLVATDVFENVENLTLREWVQWHVPAGSLTDEMQANGLVGMRVQSAGPQAGILQAVGYYLGPLGRVYQVTCYYPQDLADQYEPITNEILYSFSF